MTRLIVISRKVGKFIRKMSDEKNIRRVGILRNARLKKIVLKRQMIHTGYISDKIIDYTQRGILSAEIDRGTGELVFVFDKGLDVQDFLNGLNIA